MKIPINVFRTRLICFLMTFAIGLACVEWYERLHRQSHQPKHHCRNLTKPLPVLPQAPASFKSAELAQEVPVWFQNDLGSLPTVPQLCRYLTHRRAMITLRESSAIVGGILTDENGVPLVNTPVRFDQGRPNYKRWEFTTDGKGYFLICGFDSLEPPPTFSRFPKTHWDLPTSLFTSCPGYPDSKPGRAFASFNSAWVPCQPQLAFRQDNRAFYVVTAKQHKAFKRREFVRFLVENPRYNERDEVKIIAVRGNS